MSDLLKMEDLKSLLEKLSECKHDFANQLSIFDARLRKLEKSIPTIAENECYKKAKEIYPVFLATLEKLNNIRNRGQNLLEVKINVNSPGEKDEP